MITRTYLPEAHACHIPIHLAHHASVSPLRERHSKTRLAPRTSRHEANASSHYLIPYRQQHRRSLRPGGRVIPRHAMPKAIRRVVSQDETRAPPKGMNNKRNAHVRSDHSTRGMNHPPREPRERAARVGPRKGYTRHACGVASSTAMCSGLK